MLFLPPPRFKLKASPLQRIRGNVYGGGIREKSEQLARRSSRVKYFHICRDEAYFHRNGLWRLLWRIVMLFRTLMGHSTYINGNISSCCASGLLCATQTPNCPCVTCKGGCVSLPHQLCVWIAVLAKFN